MAERLFHAEWGSRGVPGRHDQRLSEHLTYDGSAKQLEESLIQAYIDGSISPLDGSSVDRKYVFANVVEVAVARHDIILKEKKKTLSL